MDILRRNNVTVAGDPDGPTLLFAHGFGCDQNMWRLLWPRFADRFRIVLFDHVGSGASDLDAFTTDRYASLQGYARDVVEICEALDLRDVVLVGHSVSAMIGALAATAAPERFSRLVMIGPSPRYVDDAGYVGGFTAQDVEELLDSLDSNYLGWSAAMAPAIMGNPDRPELGHELTASFCRTDPAIAAHFARVTFTSDNRGDLPAVTAPTLVLQCREDVIAAPSVGGYVADALPEATLVLLDAIGHCPHLSAPDATGDAIEAFLADLVP